MGTEASWSIGPMAQAKTMLVHIKPCADALNPHTYKLTVLYLPVRYFGDSTDVNEWLLKKGKYLDRWYHSVELFTK